MTDPAPVTPRTPTRGAPLRSARPGEVLTRAPLASVSAQYRVRARHELMRRRIHVPARRPVTQFSVVIGIYLAWMGGLVLSKYDERLIVRFIDVELRIAVRAASRR